MFIKQILRADFIKTIQLILNKHCYILAVLIAVDYFLIPKLFSNKLAIQNLHLLKTNQKITIKQLINNNATTLNDDMPIKLVTKIVNRKDNNNYTTTNNNNNGNSNANEADAFIFLKAICNVFKAIEGVRNHFQICYPPIANQTGKLAYFINGRRDVLFEQNFKTMLFKDTKLKIFTTDALNGTNMTQSSADVGADVVENICVKSYTDKNEDQNGERIKGIKDLIDEQDNYKMIEFLKYEIENATDPLVFSISSSVHASHLLLRLQSFSYLELRYLIKRLAYSLYFPYWVQHDQQENEVIYVSLVKKYSMDNYLFDNKIVYSNWTRI